MSKLTNILEALRNYQPGNKKSLADMYFERDDYMMTWQINNLCNFNCPYCGNYTIDDPDVYKYTPQHIARCFDNTKKTWHIIITGGEPFLHKHLIEICHLLSQKHFISVNSNLSSPKVIEFADSIDPQRVININASIHFSVRQERNILETFIKHFLYLQDRGFKIVGSYVVYPDKIEKFKEDIAFLHSRGLKLISSKIFHGMYQDKNYPSAYTPHEIEIITQYMNCEIEMPEYLKYTNFKGLHCGTGRKMISMKPNGNLERCLSDYNQLGNFFSGKYRRFFFDKRCKTEVCNCPYQGMLYTYRKKHLFNNFIK